MGTSLFSYRCAVVCAALLSVPVVGADPDATEISPSVYRGVDALIADVKEGRVSAALSRLGGVLYAREPKAGAVTVEKMVETINGCDPVRRRYAKHSGFPLAIVDWHCETGRYVTFLRPSREGEAGDVTGIDFSLSPRPYLKDEEITSGKAVNG